MSKSLSLNNIFVFLFLVLFPFGQIIRIDIIQPIDLIVGLGAFYAVFAKFKVPEILKHFNNFLTIATFSWLLGASIFYETVVLYGLLYLIRLTAYLYYFIYVWNFVKQKGNRELLVKSLLSLSIVSAVIGWIQFIVFPDIKPLFIWGWDMHLFRLVGSYLDPAFLGLIIVFGLVVFMYRYMNTKNIISLLSIVFLLISLAFTYSRASYLAFFVGMFYMAVSKKMYKQIIIFVAALVVLIMFLPTARNNSINLFRSFSVVARVENYKSTLKIFTKSPVFGIGYNNVCVAYNKFVGYQKFSSHSCSGSDSSLLFVLATTGVLGLIVSIYSIIQIRSFLKDSRYYVLLVCSFVALLVHSLFSNSLFYPWVMGWVVILVSITYEERN